jgi:hypothetical protein
MFIKRISFLLFPLLFISLFLKSQDRPEELLVKKDWPNVYNDFKKEVKKMPLNFIFVLDISDKTFGNEIKSIVKDFLNPVKKGDYFNVILLGNTEKTTNLTECAIVDNAKKQSIITQIDNQIFGTTGSDGVKMMDKVIDAINCPGAKDATPIIFMFSDFVHYNNGWSVPDNSYWYPLKKKFDKIKKGTQSPYVYCIELPNVDKKAQYLSYIKNIFGDINTVTCSDPKLLDDKFNSIKAKIIKALLSKIISKNVETENKHVVLQNNNGTIQLLGKDTLVYSKIELDNESKIKVDKILKSDKLFSFFPPTETEIEVSGTLVAEKYKNELPELSDINLNNQKVLMMPGNSKIPWWLTDIIAFILVISILRFIWTIIPPARLGGNIDFSMSGQSTIVKECSGSNRKYSNNDVSFLRNDFSLEVKATKKFFKGKCLIITPMNGDLLLVSRKVKKTATRGRKTIANVRTKWSFDGIEISMPRVK